MNRKPNGSPLRLFVVDDHPVVRAGIVQFLQREKGMVVCGEAGSIAEARVGIAETAPDLVLLDLLLKKVTALDFIKELVARDPGMRILVLSMMDEAVYATRCLRAGARGFIMKEEAPEELLGAIAAVLAGNSHVSPVVAQRLITAAGMRVDTSAKRREDSTLEVLTDRELEVFQLVGEGMKPRQIADILSISPKTVDAHKEHIKNKLGLHSAAELARRAANSSSRNRP